MMNQNLKTFTVPDLCDLYENEIDVGDLFLKSFGKRQKFFGEIKTAECPHSNSIVKELAQEDGKDKVLVIKHTGDDLCSMVGDQIAAMAYENNWNGIFVDGYIRRKNLYNQSGADIPALSVEQDFEQELGKPAIETVRIRR